MVEIGATVTGPSDQVMKILMVVPGVMLVAAILGTAALGARLRTFWAVAGVVGVVVLVAAAADDFFAAYAVAISLGGGAVVCVILSGVILAQRVEKGTTWRCKAGAGRGAKVSTASTAPAHRSADHRVKSAR